MTLIKAKVESNWHGYGRYKGWILLLAKIRRFIQVSIFQPKLCTVLTLFSALELEWCRARARAHRWQEECLLLDEEMRRVLAFFRWKSFDWKQKAGQLENTRLFSTSDNPVLANADIESQRAVRDGKIAYAYWQASIRDRMGAHFVDKWKSFPSKLLNMEGRDARVRVELH